MVGPAITATIVMFFFASYQKRCDRKGDPLNPSAMPPLHWMKSLNLSLSVGKLFLETGASARTVNEAVKEISTGFGCQKAEAYRQHAAIIAMLRRGANSCVEMGKVGEHGDDLRRAEALSRIVSHIALGQVGRPQAQRQSITFRGRCRAIRVGFVCLATGIACAAFGRRLHATWLSLFRRWSVRPQASGSGIASSAETKRFSVAGIGSFVSAFLQD